MLVRPGELMHPDPQRTTLYAWLAVEWARQTQAFTRSVQLYRATMARRDALGARTVTTRAPRHRVERPSRLLAPLPARAARRSDNGYASAAVDGAAPPAPVRSISRTPSRPGAMGPLTSRQAEIAALIADGLTNVQIADRLVLTHGTVGNHVAHILRRLGVKNRAQVAVWMIRRATPGTPDRR